MSTSTAVQATLDQLVGSKVHQLMWEQRLTQTDVALKLGVQQSALSKKLRGSRGWSITELKAVALILGVSTGYLLGEPGAGAGPHDDGRTRRDSNPQPSDPRSARKVTTLRRRRPGRGRESVRLAA